MKASTKFHDKHHNYRETRTRLLCLSIAFLAANTQLETYAIFLSFFHTNLELRLFGATRDHTRSSLPHCIVFLKPSIVQTCTICCYLDNRLVNGTATMPYHSANVLTAMKRGTNNLTMQRPISTKSRFGQQQQCEYHVSWHASTKNPSNGTFSTFIREKYKIETLINPTKHLQRSHGTVGNSPTCHASLLFFRSLNG